MTKLVPPTQVVALGYSIVGAMSDNAQITFHHAIAEDEDDATVNRKIDRLMAIIDRQRAKYERPAILKELRDLEDMNAQVAEDVANSEQQFQKQQAELDVQIETFNTERKKFFDTAAAKHTRSGREGSYQPRGADQAMLDRQDAGVRAAVEAKQRNEAERQQFFQNIDVSTQRRVVRIGVLNARLAEINELVT